MNRDDLLGANTGYGYGACLRFDQIVDVEALKAPAKAAEPERRDPHWSERAKAAADEELFQAAKEAAVEREVMRAKIHQLMTDAFLRRDLVVEHWSKAGVVYDPNACQTACWSTEPREISLGGASFIHGNREYRHDHKTGRWEAVPRRGDEVGE